MARAVDSRPVGPLWQIHTGRGASIEFTGCPESWVSASPSLLIVDRLGPSGVTLATATTSAVDAGATATVTASLTAAQTADLPASCKWVLVVSGDRPLAGPVHADASVGVSGATSVVVTVGAAPVTISVTWMTTDASLLTSGILPPARIGDGSIVEAKLAFAIATQAELDAVASAGTSALGAHVAASDPHPVYLTAAEGSSAFDALGSAAAVAASHGLAHGGTLAPFFRALAGARSAPVDVVYIGDSITEGAGASPVIGNRWIDRLTDSMRSLGGVAARGRGYVPATYGFLGPVGFTPSGAVTEDAVKGLGRRAAVLAATGAITATVTGTSCDVIVTRDVGGGSINVTVDGGAPTVISAAAAPFAGGGFATRITLGGGPRTLVISHASGAAVPVEGVMVYDGDEASGVRLWDAAHAGYTANSFASNLTWPQSLQAMASAELIVIALGTNDVRTGRTPAQFGANMQTIITAVRTATIPGGATVAATTPIVLLHLPEPGDGTYPDWAAYKTQLDALAAADGMAVVVDLSALISPKAAWTAMLTDGLHPGSSGHHLVSMITAHRLLGAHQGVTPTVNRDGDTITGPLVLRPATGTALAVNTASAGSSGLTVTTRPSQTAAAFAIFNGAGSNRLAIDDTQFRTQNDFVPVGTGVAAVSIKGLPSMATPLILLRNSGDGYRFVVWDNGNTSIGGFGSFGGGAGLLFLNNATPPSTNPSNGGLIYCDGGALKFRGSAGTVTTLAPA